MFLYSKLSPAVQNPTILRAPRVGASEAEMDSWLHSYTEALDSVAGTADGLSMAGGAKEGSSATPTDVSISRRKSQVHWGF